MRRRDFLVRAGAGLALGTLVGRDAIGKRPRPAAAGKITTAGPVTGIFRAGDSITVGGFPARVTAVADGPTGGSITIDPRFPCPARRPRT